VAKFQSHEAQGTTGLAKARASYAGDAPASGPLPTYSNGCDLSAARNPTPRLDQATSGAATRRGPRTTGDGRIRRAPQRPHSPSLVIDDGWPSRVGKARSAAVICGSHSISLRCAGPTTRSGAPGCVSAACGLPRTRDAHRRPRYASTATGRALRATAVTELCHTRVGPDAARAVASRGSPRRRGLGAGAGLDTSRRRHRPRRCESPCAEAPSRATPDQPNG
jgi:hypothetical protein